MYVQRLELTNYRSYVEAFVELAPGVTVFIGKNGQGKTNLVEALRYLGTLSSHRVSTDAPLVNEGNDKAFVRCTVVGDGRSIDIDLEISTSGSNRARLNNNPVAKPRDILGTLRTVLFAPEDLALVKGDPNERRRFLDELLTLHLPRFAAVRSDLDRVIKQRNSLLKSARANRQTENLESTLQVWDEQLVNLGSELILARLNLINQLQPLVTFAYSDLAPESGDTFLEYRSSVSDDLTTDLEQVRSQFRVTLLEQRKNELDRGLTLVGPQRDDLFLGLRGLPAKGYASHGESWSVALALRLASYQMLREDLRGGGDPVLILDDVFAELDVDRRQRLANAISTAEQVLITAAVANDVPDFLGVTRFEVVRGSVAPAL
ncbi:MAG: DNA replication/repair protein RecF [Actinomycetes bacterium]